MSVETSCRVNLIACVILSISGCSGGDDNSSSNSNPSQVMPAPQAPASGAGQASPASAASATPVSVAVAIAQLEASGVLPVLNRDETVAGPDENSNGVRDDIDRYINSLPDSQIQKNALAQNARAIQLSLKSDTSDTKAALDVAVKIMDSVQCLYLTYDVGNAGQKGLEIEKLTVNTKTRFDAYIAFNNALKGQVMEIPAGDTCEK